MAITEIFPNPAVKQVIYQVRFPNLFYIETKMGDLQEHLMVRFPNSALLYRQQVVFANVAPGEEPLQPVSEEKGSKSWRFLSEDESVVLNIQTNSLDISSTRHKTYNLGNRDESKFREAIQFVIQNFLAIVKIPLINRIGLRYINDIPFPSKNNDTFTAYFDSILPVEKYDLANANSMNAQISVAKDNGNIMRMESIQEMNGKLSLRLDLDAFQNNVESTNYLAVTDSLHDLIIETFENAIRAPVFELMGREATENV